MPAKTLSKAVSIFVTLCLALMVLGLVVNLPADGGPAERLVVIRSGTGLLEIGRQLKREGLIRSSGAFTLFALPYRGRLMAGEYTLSGAMSIPRIVFKMVRGHRNIYVLTIREGDNIYDVARRSEEAGIADAPEFLRVALDGDLSGRLGIGDATPEGYLAPDTYHYSREIDLGRFLEKIARRTLRIFDDPSIQARMKDLRLDRHKTLTLASMIEREAKIAGEKPLISAVFHNRLAKNMTLDCDPTVVYGTGKFGQPITKTDLRTPTPYNTYRITGLPRGPIANPDKNSILAALYPAKTDYLYFVSKNDGSHVFSKKMNEHNRYVMMYQRGKKTQ